MIVFRSPTRVVTPAPILRRMCATVAGTAGGIRNDDHQALVQLLIDVGEVETAIADALSPDADDVSPVSEALRETSTALGALVFHSWHGRRGAPHCDPDAIALVASHECASMPANMRVSVPEGYAYYGLYPETYADAAAQLAAQTGTRRPAACIIGLRSIGTSLSAVVAGTLRELGWNVRALTLRPRGHPYDREIRVGCTLDHALPTTRNEIFVIVDEGPGISGSSFASAARLLTSFGVPDDRIVFMPSWCPHHSALGSASAADVWRRHRKYVAPFERACIESGRLGTVLGAIGPANRHDLSAGKWRAKSFAQANSDSYPAVQPQHERRKYLDVSAHTLSKFVGLGSYGRAVHDRAQSLADRGFGPPVCGFAHGFLAMRWMDGEPLRSRCNDAPLLDTVGKYLAHLSGIQAGREAPVDDLIEMVRVNTSESLGESWVGRAVAALERQRATVQHRPAVCVDGRMLPHEWLHTSDGYLKTDGADHHDDHFFPATQDVAWDVAGAVSEFGWGRSESARVVSIVESLTRDTSLGQRLAFYTIAYNAYRLGYATVAAGALGSSPDATRFRRLTTFYRHNLQLAIGKISA